MSMSSDSEVSEVEAATGKYKCTHGTCTETFRREKNLDMHLYKHTGIVSKESELYSDI